MYVVKFAMYENFCKKFRGGSSLFKSCICKAGIIQWETFCENLDSAQSYLGKTFIYIDNKWYPQRLDLGLTSCIGLKLKKVETLKKFKVENY